jgi:hypothetical protein
MTTKSNVMAARPSGRVSDRCIARARALLAAGGVALCACQALPPVVSTALVGFGQDVLAAAAQNFTPQYSASMQDLFFAMAETATGMPFTQQAEEEPATAAEPYAQEAYGDGEQYGGYDQQAYPAEEYSTEQYPEQHPEQYPVEAEPYPSPAGGEPAYTTPGYVDAAAVPPAAYDTPAGVALEVALLAQQLTPEGNVTLRPVRDGDVLYDGRGDPARGDKIKLFFSANCVCHVYVIGIDATGYVAQIFPEAGGNASSLVAPGEKHLVPAGTTWWGLDEYRGVEQVYFIASRERQPDIEKLVAELAGQRPSVPASYRPVRHPAIVPVQRGLVQVQSAAPTVVPTGYGASEPVSPTLFQSTVAGADLVITRWFRHE